VKPLVRVLATLGFVGYLPVAPATWASAVVVLVGYFLPVPPLLAAIALILVGGGLAIWICGEAEKELGHDAHPIVADEVIGQSIAMLGVPHDPISFATSFALFRIFDIWKPLGAREAQRLPVGIGVVTDDVIAGITACAVQHGIWALAARLLH
jgi:phosphatidylglycerophosphatase A